MINPDILSSDIFGSEPAFTVLETRLLILASTRRDGEVACQVLMEWGINCAICPDIFSLMTEIEQGVGALLLAEEVLTPHTLSLLEKHISDQPNWSDLPIIVLTFHGQQMTALSPWSQRLGKATLVERPVRTSALISIARSLLRGRYRQYLMRKSQQQLQESEQRFKSLFEYHPDGIVVYDLAGNLISCNKAMEAIVGYSMEELDNIKIKAQLAVDDVDYVLECFAEAANGTPKTFHTRIKRRDGVIREIEAAYLPLIIDGEIKGVHGISRDVTQSKDYERRIEHLATHDVLTELPNRHLLMDRLHQAIEQSRRHNKQIGILFMDLNRFKQVNDSLGHDIGDLLLKEVAHRLKGKVRETDTVARLGGDEFVVVLDKLASIETMATIAEEILQDIAAPIKLAGHELSISTSIGGSVFPKDGHDVATLLKHADLAMYQAKELGSGSFRFYDPEMNIKILERLLTESALQRALEKDEFIIYYQPRVCVARKEIVGVEALVRWKHPEKGLIAPADFIPLAEEIGLIGDIGEWVLRTACAQNRAWQADGIPFIKMSVNLSAQQLRSASLENKVRTILSDTDLDAQYLELEITETGLMQDIEFSLETLLGIRNLGVSISIDDFGTGYSSLSHIKQLPVDTLKIDKSFICDIVNDRNDAAIVCATIAMAQHMELNVVAEGVTAPEQMLFLARHQCNEMQGYLFSRPLPADEMEVLLKSKFSVMESNMRPPAHTVH